MPRRRTVLTALLAAVGAAGAGYLAVKRAGEQRQAEVEAVQTRSRAARTAAMAKIGTRAGGSYAMHRARRAFADADSREVLDAEFELKTAEQVAAALGNMKGALMKLGQMASYLDQGLPAPVREALAELQADAPPMSAELAAQVVARELGAPPESVFEEWDPVPIASASIGQVHRAVTRDGRAVAVKVQYPGIDEAIRADLDNAGLLFTAVGMIFPGLEPGPIVEEIRDRVIEELDYRLEARNQQQFADWYADHPFIHVPNVVAELSTDRVLTTELANGARFSEVEHWSQEQRNLAGEAIYRFVFRSLYRLHAFNGDPHPGNYLFHGDGKVTFLDFGLVKHFTQQEVDVFGAMILAMVHHKDMVEFRRIIRDIGLLPDEARFDDDAIKAYFGHFYDFVQTHDDVTITPQWSSDTVRRFFDPSSEFGDIMKAANVPKSFVIVQRINLGLFAVLGELSATARWRGIADELWPFVNGPPSTELGRQEAEWLAEKERAHVAQQ